MLPQLIFSTQSALFCQQNVMHFLIPWRMGRWHIELFFPAKAASNSTLLMTDDKKRDDLIDFH